MLGSWQRLRPSLRRAGVQRVAGGGLAPWVRRLSDDKSVEFRVDRTGLGSVGYGSRFDAGVKAPETPLGRELTSQILARGPVSVYEYMRQCLLHPRHGYYARAGAERNFGAEGDFVTAPELSQLFGELIGVWFVSEWVRLGKPEAVRLVEVGPGRV